MTRQTNNSTSSLLDDAPPLTATSSAARDSDTAARRAPPPKKLLPNLAPAPRPSGSSSTTSSTSSPVTAQLSPPTSPTASTAPRRGRKPGSTNGVSRTAREAARKSNHSRIEKLRREKINDALSSLRELVPYDESVEGTAEKKNSAEKEFKLEILERTVVYLTKLKKRVQELEGQSGEAEGSITPSAQRSAAPSRSSSKHRRDEEQGAYDDDELADDEDNADEDQDMDPAKPRGPPSVASSSASRRSSIRLPPISSFLSTSSSGSSQVQTSPYLDFPLSPPDSGRSRPQQSIAPPPTLRLPASLFPKRRGTPFTQDEAASMLVQFSAERSSLSPRSPGSIEQYQQQLGYHSSIEQGHHANVRPIPRSSSEQAIRQMHPSRPPVVAPEPSSSMSQTPASMLGMSHLVSRMEVDDNGSLVRHKRQRMV